jgi:2-polyprenyl-6-methoxyphenol hydroxylase-like FAD-dependent oxidoreductase
MLEQSKTEKLLSEFISQHGNCVERGITFKSFIQKGEEVISLITLNDGSEQSITTNYIIAADGGVSTVRSYLNIPFTGKTYPDPIFILDCKAKSDLVNGEIYFTFSETSVAGFFPR